MKKSLKWLRISHENFPILGFLFANCEKTRYSVKNPLTIFAKMASYCIKS